MEDVVWAQQVNDYYQYETSPQGHFANPWVSFNSTEGNIEYSRSIWGHFIAKRFGRDAMLRTWEEIELAPPVRKHRCWLEQGPYN